MIKAKLISGTNEKLPLVTLYNFKNFEENIIKMQNLRSVYQNLDKSFIIASIDELELRGKKIGPKKLKKIFKKVITKMIEEIE